MKKDKSNGDDLVIIGSHELVPRHVYEAMREKQDRMVARYLERALLDRYFGNLGTFNLDRPHDYQYDLFDRRFSRRMGRKSVEQYIQDALSTEKKFILMDKLRLNKDATVDICSHEFIPAHLYYETIHKVAGRIRADKEYRQQKKTGITLEAVEAAFRSLYWGEKPDVDVLFPPTSKNYRRRIGNPSNNGTQNENTSADISKPLEIGDGELNK